MDKCMLLSNLDLLATAPGGVARLRELILTLAVQGKLVPQDSADEPASRLLQKIRAERDRLVAEGKIKRDKPRAEIAEEEKPFQLPQGWEWVKGRDMFSVIRGVTYQKADARDAPGENYLPILRANNIRGSINLEELVYVPSTLISDDQLLRAGDYVVCLASGSKNLVGKAAPFREAFACSFGAFCGAIRPIREIAYFAVYLASPMYRDSVSEASAGIGINNLKSSSLLDLDLALPPLAEQSRIVARVEELMRLCDALEAKGRLEATQHAQLVSTLLGTLTASTSPEELAENWQRVAQHFDLLLDRPETVGALEQTLLQLAVRGLLATQLPTDDPVKIGAPDRSPSQIPLSWSYVRFDDVLTELRYGTSVKCGYDIAGTPVIRIPNLRLGRVDTRDLKFGVLDDSEQEKLRLKRGDLLIVRSNGSASLVGSSALVDADSEGLAFAGYLVRARLNRHHIEPEYMTLVMQTLDIRRQIEGPIRTTSGVKNINSTEISGLSFALPPLAEQSRIVTRFIALRCLCTEMRQRLKAAQVTQSHLAQALVESSNAL